jgi:hypothetical protein
MFKRIFSVFVGLVTGIIIVMIGDASIHILFPNPEGINLNHKEAIESFMKSVPTSILIIMLSFWILSSFLGGYVAGKINKTEWKISAIITGSALMIVAILNMLTIPHPMWMVLLSVILYIPASYIGGKLAS